MVEKDSGRTALVTYEREGSIGTITLNRPEKRNAMTIAMWKELDDAIGAAEEDEAARVIILRGEGKSFCAGLDLSPESELAPIMGGTPGAGQKTKLFKIIKEIQAIHTRLEHLRQPTMAVIHGHCLGAGLELIVCCDMRMCSADAQFALPEARLAIITDVGGLQRLPRIVGNGHAREIAFRAHRFDAERARSINLANHVYPDRETLSAESRKIAEEIASNPPLAVQGAKDVMLFHDDMMLDASLRYNAARSSMILPSEDLFEAVAAHMQKRKGTFKGA
ncbi:MAG: enoyl-CoA hydratase [Deltaproteobacteria bacterium]|nr:MAG: enoyl-CoA hydratase [Deltaproteobacteria bacterium]